MALELIFEEGREGDVTKDCPIRYIVVVVELIALHGYKVFESKVR